MTATLQVLGIDVSDALLAQWAQWLAPERQPFLVRSQEPVGELSDELRDTYELYGLTNRGLSLTWYDEQQFAALPRPERAALVRSQVHLERAAVPSVRRWGHVVGAGARTQADGYRFVWWPSVLHGHERRVLPAFVTNDRLPSQHARVPEAVWAAAAPVVPEARRLSGSFPACSGPNCFGTVMAAAGVPGAKEAWMQREPFEDWLARSTRRGGRDTDPGTVFVWRSASGDADHAAVTLGGGWAVHKPSQGWMSPVKVLPVEDLKRRGGGRGLRLHRYALD